MIRLLLNEETRNHGKLLRSWLRDCDDGFIAVAFLKEAGLRIILDEMKSFLERGGDLRMVIGTDFFLTEPSALRRLLQLGREFPSFEWRIVEQSSVSTFHPKYYRFSAAGHQWVMTGSANLTEGGLTGNIETSALAEGRNDGDLAKESKRIETELWLASRCQMPTEERIGDYAICFELMERRRKQAEDLARKELQDRPRLFGEKLETELRIYRDSEKEQVDLVARRENYARAKKLIEKEIIVATKVTQSSFDEFYGKLVADGEGVKLWHSGGVHRSKGKISAQKDKVVAMIRELARDTSRSPEEIFTVRQDEQLTVTGLGPNIFTEICNTLAPERYAVLNKNPLTSLRVLGGLTFPEPQLFKPEDYGSFCRCMDRLRERCNFADLGETDHFLNFVYWRHRDSLTIRGDDEGAEEDN